MKFKICNKCGEIVTKTGFFSSHISCESKKYAKCHNKECGKIFTEKEYQELKEEEF